MGRRKYIAYVHTGAAVGLTGVLLVGTAPRLDNHFEHPLNAPSSAFANLGVSTSVASLASGSTVEWTAFRAQLAQPIETLSDEVNDYILRAPVTLVMRPSSRVACTSKEPCVNSDDGEKDVHDENEDRLPAEYGLNAEGASYRIKGQDAFLW